MKREKRRQARQNTVIVSQYKCYVFLTSKRRHATLWLDSQTHSGIVGNVK